MPEETNKTATEEVIEQEEVVEKSDEKETPKEEKEVQEQKEPPKPAKSKQGGSGSKSCLGCFGIGCLGFILLCIVALIGGYFLFKGALDVDDFEAESTEEGYEEFFEKSGVNFGDVEYDDFCFTCDPLVYEGEKPQVVVVTDSEVSSWFEHATEGIVVMNNTQMRFSEDLVELKSNVEYAGTSYPVYLAGDVERVGDKELMIDVSTVKVGGFSIPAEYTVYVEEFLEEMVNSKLLEIDGLNVYKLEFSDGQVNFEGTVPENVSY